jgi:His/Glu/Gln/Arg/opine family amino acid ABC transporter permease subunit
MESNMINNKLLISSLPKLLQGFLISFQISSISFIIGITGGLLLALCLLSKNKILLSLGNIYVLLFRGTPMIIQIFILFFMFQSFDISINALYSVIIAIGANSIAYMSQIIKSGIQSINKGEIEAAQTLGLTPYQIYKNIIVPQAIKNILPSIGNECVTLLKDSSLAHIIGVSELTYEGNIIIGYTYDAITIYAGVGIFYLIGTSLITIAFYFYESKLNDIKN